jgi:AcrR family transcriptional regulator
VPSAVVTKRSVGRPRQFDDGVERRLILDAAYAALRDRGADFTVADVLSKAGVSTRSFYRHFDSKDALLHAMYLRDGEWAADRLTKRLAEASGPREAVEWWIDEIFSFTRSPRRAERVSVLGSITGVRANDADEVTARGRELLVEPLRAAIAAGCSDGSFTVADPVTASELVAVAVLHAAGLTIPHRPLDHSQTAEFCMRALGSSA